MLLKILTTFTFLTLGVSAYAAEENQLDRDPAGNKIQTKRPIERTASAETSEKEESVRVRTTRSSKAF